MIMLKRAILTLIILIISSTIYAEKVKIAILDFGARGVSKNTANNTSELIRGEMINTRLFTIIERSQLKQILAEQGFQQIGCTDVSCAVKLGQLMNVQKILIGTVMKLGNKIIISGRIVDIESGVAEFSEKYDVGSENQLYNATLQFTKKLVNRIFKQMSYLDEDIDYSPSGIDVSKQVYRVRKLAFKIINEAEALSQSGKIQEAGAFVQALKVLHPGNNRIEDILNKLTDEEKSAVNTSLLLGVNKISRIKVRPTSIEKFLWYLPDRILDFLDIFSANASIGGQIGGGVWATRILQANGYAGAKYCIGLFPKKNLGFMSEASAEIGAGPLVICAISNNQIGTAGIKSASKKGKFHLPSQPLYQYNRDYWAIGGKLGYFLGIEFEFHPVEFFDFITGLFLFDPLDDDMATTSRIILEEQQNDLLNKFLKNLRLLNENDIEVYKEEYNTL